MCENNKRRGRFDPGEYYVRFSFDEKDNIYLLDNKVKHKLLPSRKAREISNKSKSHSQRPSKRVQKKYHSDEDVQSSSGIEDSNDSISEKRESEEESEEVDGSDEDMEDDQQSQESAHSDSEKNYEAYDEKSNSEEDAESSEHLAHQHDKKLIFKNKYKGTKKFQEDEGHGKTAPGKTNKLRERLQARSHKYDIERGAKTDYEINDMPSDESKQHSASNDSESSISASALDEQVKKLNEGIKNHIDQTDDFLVEERKFLEDTQDEKPLIERPNTFEDLEGFVSKKKAGMVKREGQTEKESYEPINENDNARYEEESKVYDNHYDLLLNRLQLNYVPENLPCREDKKRVIREFIESGLRNRGSSTSLYISGMPGTGKTATTLEVIKKLNEDRKNKFKFIHVNGMQLNNSSVMYTLIYKAITGQKHKPTTAAVLLDDYFKKKNYSETQLKNQQMIVLLVDELDALVTKKQTLLYNLFDWPSNKNSGLIICAIANTMDLPERFLVKIKSRIGESRLVYQPYSLSQIETIIKVRIAKKNLFMKDSIKIVARKISSLSGDIRRALQVCRRATELAKTDWTRMKKLHGPDTPLVDVDINHIQKSFNELYTSKNNLLLKALRKYEKLVIIGVMIEINKDGQDKVKLVDVATRVGGMSHTLGYDKLTHGEIMEILLRLKSFGIVAISNEKPKLDNIHIQPFIYVQDIVTAYEMECKIFENYKNLLGTERNK